MRELQRLEADHDLAVLAFELGNREYFAASISDRGDAFFERFSELYGDLLAEQAGGGCAYYVLLGENGCVLGRFNLYDVKDGTAVLGYRVGQRFAGHGLATAAVLELCRLAVARHGVRTIRAAASDANVASRRVLEKAGFVPDGPADPAGLGGEPGAWYRRNLTA